MDKCYLIIESNVGLPDRNRGVWRTKLSAQEYIAKLESYPPHTENSIYYSSKFKIEELTLHEEEQEYVNTEAINDR